MSEDTYFMARNNREARRLDEQGLVFETYAPSRQVTVLDRVIDLFGSALDYQIHPDIAAKLPPNPVIADIGTGTGDFLVRLSKNCAADAQFYGFDISHVQFLPDSILPANVKLHVQDVKQPFSVEWHGKFDFVHLRMLVGGMDKDDWLLATRNIMQLLRPGGAVQWEEGDFVTANRIRGGPAGTTARNLQYALTAFQSEGSYRFRYGYCTLPEAFTEAGLKQVDQDVVSSDRVFENRERMGRVALDAVVMWAKNIQEKGGDADFWPGHTVDEVARNGYDDIARGAYSRFDIYNTIGFKQAEPIAV